MLRRGTIYVQRAAQIWQNRFSFTFQTSPECSAALEYTKKYHHPLHTTASTQYVSSSPQLPVLPRAMITPPSSLPPSSPYSTSAPLSSSSITNLKEFRLAQPGEGIQECELLRWFVGEGDPIEEFGRLCEVQSDKATIEITSPFAGIVKRLHYTVGQAIPVGEVMADILMPGEAGGGGRGGPGGGGGVGSSISPLEAIAMTQSEKEVINGNSESGHAVTAVLREEEGNRLQGNSKGGGLEVATSPAVRRLAQELHVDLNQVVGTGPSGRITKADVMAYVEEEGHVDSGGGGGGGGGAVSSVEDVSGATGPTGSGYTLRGGGSTPVLDSGIGTYHPLSSSMPPPSPLPSPSPMTTIPTPTAGASTEPTIVPLRGYRKAMFKSMSAVAAIPHFHYCDEVCADALVSLRWKLQGAPALKGSKLTFMPFFIKAAAMALAEHPIINSSLAPSGDAIMHHATANIGIAVATPLGLVVPNIKNVQELSIADIAGELARLQSAAMSNQLRPDDLSGATFTISNIGVVGGTYATPLINPPEVAIMALGRIQRVPRFEPSTLDASPATSTTVVPTHVLGMSLGADHRVVDGAALANFGLQWKTIVEDPQRLLLELR